jgi:hypothetical protein
MYKLLMLCAALALLSTPAQARCRDDIQDMKPRIDRIKNADPERYQLATRWWGRAVEAEPGSELECSTFIERAHKALTMPMADSCNGANANLARCAHGGFGAGYGGPGAAGAGAGFALGGGGGGGGAATGAAATPFMPPGSVRSDSHSK